MANSRDASTVLHAELRRLRTALLFLFPLFILFQAAAFYFLAGLFWPDPQADWTVWAPGLILASVTMLIAGVIAVLLVTLISNRGRKRIERAIIAETKELRLANNRASVLQTMGSTLSATLSFERVMEVALDVCGQALEEMGVPARTFVGAVFLFDRDNLTPVASRRLIGRDEGKRLQGKQGIVGDSLKKAEIISTIQPQQDPELKGFAAFQNCHVASSIPLRAGFQIYGAMVLGTELATGFSEGHLELFEAVANQAVIALQNAELFQNLTAEKQRIIEAEEDARRELARDLHDGPTQSVAAIAMRINFVATLMTQDPKQAFVELRKVEDLAKATSKEIRGMLFTLRPLVLESQGLGAAVEAAMARAREAEGINMQVLGAEYGDLLSDQAQGVVFYILDEALGNARKHAHAKNIEIRLWREGNLFVARVRDDGVGFNPSSVNANYSSRGSLGMVNMRERAERIDGSLKIESSPGQGTAITLVVPLDRHGRKAVAATH
jgi:signal transduction histidine kinase